MKKLSDKMIIECWKENAKPWAGVIQRHEIESRVEVTNQAIVDAVLSKDPQKVLDVGCGEGWLVRKLVENSIDCLGIDAVPALVDIAKAGKGRYRLVPYEELSYTQIGEQFDVLVANFSLLGKESVENIFQQANGLLRKGASFIVQTIHPIASSKDSEYVDGWREGSWQGFSSDFSNPAPWYFRTLESWKALFIAAGFEKIEVIEPLNPKSKTVASLILIGELRS